MIFSFIEPKQDILALVKSFSLVAFKYIGNSPKSYFSCNDLLTKHIDKVGRDMNSVSVPSTKILF